MSAILIDGFDMYNGIGTNTGLQARWQNVGTTSGFSMSTGRFGGQALRMAGGASAPRMRKTFTSSPSSFSFGIAIKCEQLPTSATNATEVSILSSGTYMVGLQVTTTGAINLCRLGTFTVLGSTASAVVDLANWHYYECEIVIDSTAGSFTLWQDGVQLLNLTGINTRNGTPTTVDTLELGPTVAVSGTTLGIYDYDDIYVIDAAAKLGERRVETLRPNGDTATKTWTPLTGTANYAMVDETLVDGDTSYVQASVVGNRDLYTLTPLSSTPTAIDAIQISSFAEKTDATTRTIYNSVQSAGTDSDGSAFALSASYSKYERIIGADPNGGGTWIPSRINGLQIGPKVAS